MMAGQHAIQVELCRFQDVFEDLPDLKTLEDVIVVCTSFAYALNFIFKTNYRTPTKSNPPNAGLIPNEINSLSPFFNQSFTIMISKSRILLKIYHSIHFPPLTFSVVSFLCSFSLLRAAGILSGCLRNSLISKSELIPIVFQL